MADLERGQKTAYGTKISQPNSFVALPGKRTDNAIAGWCAGRHWDSLSKGAQKRFADAMAHYRIKKGHDELVIHLPHPRQTRALALNANTSGGYLVPEGWAGAYEAALLRFSPVREIAGRIVTEKGNDLPYPTVNDLTNKATIQVESQPLGFKDIGSFGQVVFHSWKWNTGIIAVPYELVEDGGSLFAEAIAQLLGERVARGQNTSFSVGTGVDQPLGLLNAVTSGKTAGSPTALTLDDLVALWHSVPEPYRLPSANPSWMMSDTTLLGLHGLKDAQGRYLMWSGGDKAEGWSFLGAPIITNNDYPSVLASGVRSVTFGMHSKYVIRDVATVRLRRLVERFGDSDQEGYLMLVRGDALLLDAGSHPVRCITH